MKTRNFNHQLSRPRVWGAVCVLAGGILLAGVAHAQREPRDEPGGLIMVAPAPGFGAEMDGDGPIVRHSHELTPQERQRMREEMRQLQAMTPAQRDEFFRQKMARAQAAQEDDVREALAMLGEEDAEKQNLIVTFIKQQRLARRPLNKKRRELAQALLGGQLSDEEAVKRQGELSEAVEKSKTEYEAALKELDEKVAYSKKPRLQALLLACGVLGDAAGYTSGPSGFETFFPPKIGPGL